MYRLIIDYIFILYVLFIFSLTIKYGDNNILTCIIQSFLFTGFIFILQQI